MGIGFEVYNDQGKLQISSDLMQYYLHSKGTGKLSRQNNNDGVVDVRPPGNKRPTYTYGGGIFDPSGAPYTGPTGTDAGFIALRCTEPLVSGGALTLSANSPDCDWYRFEPFSDLDPSNSRFGLQLFNSAGKVTFDLGAKPLVISAVQRVNSLSAGTNYTLGLPGGRKYAFIINKPSLRVTKAFVQSGAGTQLPDFNATSSTINITSSGDVRIADSGYETDYAGSNSFDGLYTIIDVTGY